MEINVFEDYWKVFPNHKIYKELAKQSSITMWILFLLYNYSKMNPLASMLNTDLKKMEIENSFVKKKVNWIDIENLKEVYKEKVLTTRARKELGFYYEQLELRRLFIESLTYDASTYEIKEKLLKGTKSLWDEFAKIEEMVNKEDSMQSQVQGGRVESISEQKLI